MGTNSLRHPELDSGSRDEQGILNQVQHDDCSVVNYEVQLRFYQ